MEAVNRVVEGGAEAIEGTRWKGGSQEYYIMVTQDIGKAFNTGGNGA